MDESLDPRRQTARKMRQEGVTFNEIGVRLGVSKQRARQLVLQSRVPADQRKPKGRKSRQWTEEEDAQLEILTNREAAARFGCCVGVISNRRQLLGLPKSPGRPAKTDSQILLGQVVKATNMLRQVLSRDDTAFVQNSINRESIQKAVILLERVI